MRHGIEERDYAREITQWRALAAAVEARAEADEQDAIALVLGNALAPVKAEAQTAEEAKAKQRVSELIGRSRKAFGFLYAALPVDLRPLVADVPQGYAFGIWSFLEKRFRSTEQDSVMALWERLTTMRQEADETHDVYKARVDSVVELLKHAQQAVAPGLYTSLLLWRLQPRYSTAVLTLKTSEHLKDPAAVDWPFVAEYMAQYERSQMGLGDSASAGAGDRVMAARGQVSAPSSSGSGAGASKPSSGAKRDHSDVECYNCHQFGHYASRCPLPDRRQKGQQYEGQAQKQRQPSRAHRAAGASRKHAGAGSGRASDGDDDDDQSEGRPSPRTLTTAAESTARLHMVRQLNRFALLTAADNDDEPVAQMRCCAKSYCARVLAGMGSATRASAPAAASAPAPAAGATNTKKTKKQVSFGPPTEATARERDRRQPTSHTPKTLDQSLRTSALAIDTAATVSITGNKNNLVNVRRCQPMPILMADQGIVSAVYKGDMPIRLPVADKPAGSFVTLTIRNVYFHERIDANLLSWGCMCLDGWEMHSTKKETYVVTPKGARINASTRGKLTILDNAGTERAYAARMGRFVCQSADDLLLLHQRVGHASWNRLLKMCRAGATAGVGDVSVLSVAELQKAEGLVRNCDACATGKQRRNALGHRGLDKGTEKGEVLHMDTFYVMMRHPQTNEKYREYCLLVTDGYTQLRWLARTTSLRDVQAEMIHIIGESTNACGRAPRLVVSDLGTEFDNNKVKAYCRERGIRLQPSPARAKELNGIAEKSVDTVKNHVRAMLLASGMPEQTWWWRAAAHHVYLWNRTHIGSATGVTPYEATLAREPSILHVGVLGCDAFVHMDRSQRDTTFSPKAEPGIYLGHDSAQNCPTVYMLRSGKTLKVKDVLFRENSFKHLRAMQDARPDSVPALDLSELEADEQHSSELPSESGTSELESKDDVEADLSEDEAEQQQADTNQRFDVRAITDQRTTASGKLEYRVRWTGYSASTWEPADTIREDAPKAVREYEAFLAHRSEARVTRSRSAAAAQASSSSASSASAAAAASRADSDDEDSERAAVSAARLCAAQCL